MLVKILSLHIFFIVALTRFQTVAIIGTNDIHGSAFPTELYRSDTSESYTYGGLQVMAQMIETLRREYGRNLLYLDAGDQFQGGIESSSLVSSGQIMNDFYNSIGLDAAAIGNHQFDFGPQFLFPYWAARTQTTPNLAANIRSEKDQQNFLPLHKGQTIFTTESGVKIGVIGLTTIQTPSTTGAFNEGLFPSYKFLNYIPILVDRSAKIRSLGANAVILVSHIGNDCNTDNTFGIWEENTAQYSQCSKTDQISTILKGLPAGTLDGVVQGHRHKFSHHFINGIPVLGTINGGYYFNILHLKFFDGKLYDKNIEGPIPVCEKVFENTRTCNYLSDDELHVAGPLVPWNFHGRTVQKHQQLSSLFSQKWLPLMQEYLIPLVRNQIYLQRIYNKQNELGNLITNLMHSVVPDVHVVIANSGGFRSIWIPGVIQYQHFYNMFPFSNTLVSFQMTGKQLLDTLQIVQSGAKAFYPTKGLKQVIGLSILGDKKLLDAKFYDGKIIELGQNYRVLSINFLTMGGDDFKNVIGKVYTIRKQIVHGDLRQLLQKQIMKLGTIKKNTLIDLNNPRLQVVPF